MSTATHADAQLLVSIMSSPVAERSIDGMNLLRTYDEPPSYEQVLADHPLDSPGWKAISSVLLLNEMIGTFVKQNLLDRGLVLDLLWVAGSWERVAGVALGQRERTGVAELYENFEALATGEL